MPKLQQLHKKFKFLIHVSSSISLWTAMHVAVHAPGTFIELIDKDDDTLHANSLSENQAQFALTYTIDTQQNFLCGHLLSRCGHRIETSHTPSPPTNACATRVFQQRDGPCKTILYYGYIPSQWRWCKSH